MKKFFSMMVAVAAMFTFAACGGDDTTDPAPKPGSKTQLAQPVVTVTAQTENSFTISWEAVENATEYLVYLDKNNQPKTTSTTYTFSDLNAGTYKPRVKALGGENYKDSEYSAVVEINITGATSVDWFTHTVRLPEDNAENDAKGINSSNAVLFNWKGNGVQSLKYTYFDKAEYPSITDDQIIKLMGQPLSDKMLAEVNSEAGADLMFSDLAGETDYVFCAYVIKGDKTFLDKKEIKTGTVRLTLGTQAWLGAWNAHTPQMVTMPTQENGLKDYTFVDQRSDINLDVESYTFTEDKKVWYSHYVWVDGLSVLGEDVPAFGYVYHESEKDADGYSTGVYTGNYCLDLMCYESLGELGEGSGVYALWMPLCSKGTSNYTFVMGSFAGFTLTLNPTTNEVTCTPGAGLLSDESPFEVKMMDVFGVNPDTNELYTMVDEEENIIDTYRAGGILGVTKAAASPSPASVAPKALKAAAVPASVVVAM